MIDYLDKFIVIVTIAMFGVDSISVSKWQIHFCVIITGFFIVTIYLSTSLLISSLNNFIAIYFKIGSISLSYSSNFGLNIKFPTISLIIFKLEFSEVIGSAFAIHIWVYVID